MLEFLKQPVSLKRPNFKRRGAPETQSASEAPNVAETPGTPEAQSAADAPSAPKAASGLRRSVSFKRPSAPKLPSLSKPSGLARPSGFKKPRGFKKPGGAKQPGGVEKSGAVKRSGGLNRQVSFKQLTSLRFPSAGSLLSGGASRPGRARSLVGLEIEPGQLIAAQSRVNGHVVVERAAGKPIAANIVRDGEVSDVAALTTALEELFEGSGLDRRVRIGIANQRIVMRQMELPPITDPKELQNAVYFQAQDEIPMPIDSVVLDFHTLGIADTPQGPRMQVLLVAARRDMVERMLEAARGAGLRPEGVDLAAFGMIRALRPLDAAEGEQVLYLSIGGLTNLAIATGATCQFTRVITTGIEHVVAEVAANAGVPLADARRLVAGVGPEAAAPAGESAGSSSLTPATGPTVAPGADNDGIARAALSDGIRRIAAEVRNSLDFHLASAHGVGAVTRAVLTGPALDVPGFDVALGRELGLTLDRGAVEVANEATAGHVPMSRLAVAAGLSVTEGPQ